MAPRASEEGVENLAQVAVDAELADVSAVEDETPDDHSNNKPRVTPKSQCSDNRTNKTEIWSVPGRGVFPQV